MRTHSAAQRPGRRGMRRAVVVVSNLATYKKDEGSDVS